MKKSKKQKKPISKVGKFFRILIWSLLGLFLLFIICGLQYNLKIRYYTIDSELISENVRILIVSDLHSCKYGKNQEKLINAIDEINPDIIALTGDIVDDELPEEPAYELLSFVAENYDCYYISGNHEAWSGKEDEIKDVIRGLGITVLEGETVFTTIGNQTISLSGVDDKYNLTSETVSRQYENAVSELKDDVFSILLSHRSNDTANFIKYDFDLVLAGHMHGGQWRIPGLVNGIYTPNEGLFPDHCGGYYNLSNGSVLIVSRGLAKETTLIPRLYNPPELVVVDLK